MKTTVEIDTDKPEEYREILGQSLTSDQNVEYSLETREDQIQIQVRADGIGPLRGCTDTIFRLSSLVKKLY
ncbi:MAG: hypothetical protein ABEK00_01645 [Candidatus Nanohaloarchaea archaeon]